MLVGASGHDGELWSARGSSYGDLLYLFWPPSYLVGACTARNESSIFERAGPLNEIAYTLPARAININRATVISHGAALAHRDCNCNRRAGRDVDKPRHACPPACTPVHPPHAHIPTTINIAENPPMHDIHPSHRAAHISADSIGLRFTLWPERTCRNRTTSPTAGC